MAWWDDKPSSRELARRNSELIKPDKDIEDLKEAFHKTLDALPGAISDVRGARQKDQSDFHSRYLHASAEEKRVELKRLRRELERRNSGDSSREIIDVVKAGIEIYLQGRATGGQFGDVPQSIETLIKRLTKEELKQRIDFLEEHINSRPTGHREHEAQLAQYRSRRFVDAEAELFEQLEHRSITRVEAQKLYKKRRLAIQREESLDPEERENELEHIEKDFKAWMKKHHFSIFEDD